MRTVLVMAVLCCIVAVGQTSTDSQRDSHQSSAQQAVAILLADNGRAPIPGFLETRMSQLGDDAAVGVIQYLGERKTTTSKDFTSPQEIQRILRIIRMAFAVPNINHANGNRTPKATLVLLQYLTCLPAATAVKSDLENTSKFVEQLKSASATTK